MNEIPKIQSIKVSSQNIMLTEKSYLKKSIYKPYIAHVSLKKKTCPQIACKLSRIYIHMWKMYRNIARKETCPSEESYICEGATLLMPFCHVFFLNKKFKPAMSSFVRYLEKYLRFYFPYSEVVSNLQF